MIHSVLSVIWDTTPGLESQKRSVIYIFSFVTFAPSGPRHLEGLHRYRRHLGLTHRNITEHRGRFPCGGGGLVPSFQGSQVPRLSNFHLKGHFCWESFANKCSISDMFSLFSRVISLLP